MPDEEEFAARSPLKWMREGDAYFIAAGEWAAWSATRTTPACGDQKRRPR